MSGMSGMSGRSDSSRAGGNRVDLSAVATADLLREIERRCSAGAAASSGRTAKDMPFATKALWAQDRANKARSRLDELRALPVPTCEAERAARAAQEAQLAADVTKYDGMAKAFTRKGI